MLEEYSMIILIVILTAFNTWIVYSHAKLINHYKDVLKAMKELREYNELLIELYRMRNSDKEE